METCVWVIFLIHLIVYGNLHVPMGYQYQTVLSLWGHLCVCVCVWFMNMLRCLRSKSIALAPWTRTDALFDFSAFVCFPPCFQHLQRTRHTHKCIHCPSPSLLIFYRDMSRGGRGGGLNNDGCHGKWATSVRAHFTRWVFYNWSPLFGWNSNNPALLSFPMELSHSYLPNPEKSLDGKRQHPNSPNWLILILSVRKYC